MKSSALEITLKEFMAIAEIPRPSHHEEKIGAYLVEWAQKHMLKKKLYEDFQCFDAAAVSAGNQTATAIKASYVPLDLKTDKFESEVTRFIVEILRLAGIEDQPSYTRNQIINKSEETQNILLGAAYYDDEYITKKLLTINGDIDQYEDMAKRKAAEEIDRSFAEPDAPEVNGDGEQ